MGCENNCVNERRIKSLEDDFRELKSNNSKDHKEFYNRLEAVEKDMVSSKSDREHINGKLDEISNNVKSLMQKPGKRYETIVTCILTAVVGAIVGFIMSGILPV